MLRFFWKTVQVIFKITLRLRDRHIFKRQPVGILNVFNTLNLKQIFWKTKTFFEKLGNKFLDGNTWIENSSSQYKTAILEANIETNRTISSKWTYLKEWGFSRNYFIFLEILLYIKNDLKSVDLMYQWPKCPCSYFS